jgi:hypothetical protein
MANLIAQYMTHLETIHLPGLPQGCDYIYPAYQGNSIVNIPASLARVLDLPPFTGQTLVSDLLADLDHAQRIIFIVMDGIALHRFERWIAEESASVWKGLVKDGTLAPLTSVTPSTTSAALLSLWTGECPATHGVVGYELWLKEYGIVTNMILFAPISYQGAESRRLEGSLENAGFRPKNYLNVPTVASHLLKHGVETHAFHHHMLASSGLSQMLLNDVHGHAFSGAADLWVDVHALLEAKSNQKLLAYVYWGQVDHLSHFYGPDDDRPRAEFSLFSIAFERFFLSKLRPSERRDTLLIFTADHGQIYTAPDALYDLNNHPRLEKEIHIMPTGENRLIYLHVRPGRMDAVRQYIQETWPDQFHVIPSMEAVAAGLFGDGDWHPGLADRVGDLLLIPKEKYYLWWANKKDHLHGRHGGLHREEMLVPFLAVHL